MQLKDAMHKAQGDQRIVPWASYGEHIDLMCSKHPDKRWSTKNILYIGARNIFYNLMHTQGMGTECTCSIGELEPVVPEDWENQIV